MTSSKLSGMNSINVILPYKALGMWVFDDERVGLVQEPFVGGADTLIDSMVAEIPGAEEGFRMIFSQDQFPGYQWSFTWVRPEMSGNVYQCTELGAEGWLCPALFKYFEAAPKELFVKCEAIPAKV